MVFHYVTKESSRFSQLPLPLCYCGISLAFTAKETRAYHLSATFHHYRLYLPVDNTTICDIVAMCLTINTKT